MDQPPILDMSQAASGAGNAVPAQRDGIFVLQQILKALTRLQQTWRPINRKKVLAGGTLTNASTVLYTVPAGNTALVQFISLTNKSGGSEVPVISYTRTGAVQIYAGALASATSAHPIAQGTEIVLEAGDILSGKTTNNTAVDYLITGIEQPNND